VPIEARLYSHLFSCEDPPDDDWESALNPDSEVVKTNALMDPSIFKWDPQPESHYQFERLGFFVLDRYSPIAMPSISEATTTSVTKMVFNLTVPLKDSKPKEAGAPSKSRKEEQAKQLADKMARMSLAPQDMYRPPHCDLYSQFDDDGVPTHDKAGEKLSKSGIKKLRKDWEKQKKLFESSRK